MYRHTNARRRQSYCGLDYFITGKITEYTEQSIAAEHSISLPAPLSRPGRLSTHESIAIVGVSGLGRMFR